MAAYVKKAANVEAVQFNGSNGEDIEAFVAEGEGEAEAAPEVVAGGEQRVKIKTDAGVVVLQKGDYVVKGPNGEISVSSGEAFVLTYEGPDVPDVPDVPEVPVKPDQSLPGKPARPSQELPSAPSPK